MLFLSYKKMKEKKKFIHKCIYVIQILVSLACLLKSLQHIEVQKYSVDVDIQSSQVNVWSVTVKRIGYEYDGNAFVAWVQLLLSFSFFRYGPPFFYVGALLRIMAGQWYKHYIHPHPLKNCAAFKNVCIHQCVHKCVYMYIVRPRFYTNFYIVSKRKQNDQFSLKGLKKICSV